MDLTSSGSKSRLKTYLNDGSETQNIPDIIVMDGASGGWLKFDANQKKNFTSQICEEGVVL